MTSPIGPETASDAPPRPAVVAVAFWFHVALVVLLLILVGTAIVDAVHHNGLIDEAARATNADPQEVAIARDDNLTGVLFACLPLGVLALWLGGTVWGMRRGSNVARILTWVGLAAPVVLALLSCLLGGLFGFVGLFLFALLLPDDPAFDEAPVDDDASGWTDGTLFYDKLYSLDSGGWSIAFDAIMITAAALALLLAIALGVLLLTGPANRYFRPQQTPRRPPMPYGPSPAFAFPPAGPTFPPYGPTAPGFPPPGQPHPAGIYARPPAVPTYSAADQAFPPAAPSSSPAGQGFPPAAPSYPAAGHAFPPAGPPFAAGGPTFPPPGAAYPHTGFAYPQPGAAYPQPGFAYPQQGASHHPGAAYPQPGPAYSPRPFGPFGHPAPSHGGWQPPPAMAEPGPWAASPSPTTPVESGAVTPDHSLCRPASSAAADQQSPPDQLPASNPATPPDRLPPSPLPLEQPPASSLAAAQDQLQPSSPTPPSEQAPSSSSAAAADQQASPPEQPPSSPSSN